MTPERYDPYNVHTYSDMIREALQYLLEHELTPRIVAELERNGFVRCGSWQFTGMSKKHLRQLYCITKNLQREYGND